MQTKENILIAEIGSTSGSWAFISNNGTDVQIIKTQGYNPHTHNEYILERLLIKLKSDIGLPEHIIYYGTGVVSTDVSEMIMRKISLRNLKEPKSRYIQMLWLRHVRVAATIRESCAF